MDERLFSRKPTDFHPHNIFAVYREMFAQICMDYASLPDPRTLTMAEIRFFYNAERKSLQRTSKQG